MIGDDELIPAATVLLIRDGPDGPEVLMLRRNSRIAFGGMWVFPGGRVDDHELDPDDHVASARVAAVREVAEETGLQVTGARLETWSYWIPPVQASMKAPGPRRRFSTWFFVTRSPQGDVAVDGGEIHEHLWLTPADAIAKRQAGEIELVPPTWVTLWQLGQHADVAAALAWARTTEPGEFRTRPIHNDPTTLAWAGDVAHYGGGAHDDDGPRHRLIMEPDGWVYERSAS
ncbi:MAG: NUDIX hydrolase [Acidimicrobiia bacterium]|nr:NUDIX hydrolase [Acidimicrobiia bacterium]